MEFSDNTALIGPVAYLGRLDYCSWNQQEGSSFFELSNVFKWPFIHIEENINLAHPENSQKDPQLYVQTPAMNLNVTSVGIDILAPGEPLQLQHVALDQLDHPTAAVLRIHAYTDSPNQVTTQA